MKIHIIAVWSIMLNLRSYLHLVNFDVTRGKNVLGWELAVAGLAWVQDTAANVSLNSDRTGFHSVDVLVINGAFLTQQANVVS